MCIRDSGQPSGYCIWTSLLLCCDRDKNNKFKRNERGASGYRQFNDKRTPLKQMCIRDSIWTWLYNKNDYGLFNTILEFFNLPAQNWLSDSDLAMNGIIVMNVWKSIGYYALIILASLKTIPAEINEAAMLDQARGTRKFFKITLPMLSPQLFFILITITTGTFKVFDSIRIMTNGGPGDTTKVISMYIYDYAFQRNNTLGIASAAGVVLSLIHI